jgi:plasmid stability protein
MGAIHIENVDEQLLRSIRIRAYANRRSFEDEVKAVLAEAAKPRMTTEEFIAEMDRIRAMTPKGVAQEDSADMIREMRDRGYSNL